MTYEIEAVDPNTIFIVLRNEHPLIDPQGQTVVFYRRKDAEDFVAYQQSISIEGEGAR